MSSPLLGRANALVRTRPTVVGDLRRGCLAGQSRLQSLGRGLAENVQPFVQSHQPAYPEDARSSGRGASSPVIIRVRAVDKRIRQRLQVQTSGTHTLEDLPGAGVRLLLGWSVTVGAGRRSATRASSTTSMTATAVHTFHPAASSRQNPNRRPNAWPDQQAAPGETRPPRFGRISLPYGLKRHGPAAGVGGLGGPGRQRRPSHAQPAWTGPTRLTFQARLAHHQPGHVSPTTSAVGAG